MFPILPFHFPRVILATAHRSHDNVRRLAMRVRVEDCTPGNPIVNSAHTRSIPLAWREKPSLPEIQESDSRNCRIPSGKAPSNQTVARTFSGTDATTPHNNNSVHQGSLLMQRQKVQRRFP